jgi:2OG-Fe(II) oxygenase superfamily
VRYVPRGRLHAHQVRDRLPWLYELYHGAFLELAGETCEEEVSPAVDDRYGVVLNVQRGTRMRFECHIDSNPLTGLLFCTDHVDGGELVFAHDATAASIAEVERDCSVVRPLAGHLIFFDARQYPHYVRPLTHESDIRVVAVMNYYTETSPEADRPHALNRHLYGDK